MQIVDNFITCKNIYNRRTKVKDDPNWTRSIYIFHIAIDDKIAVKRFTARVDSIGFICDWMQSMKYSVGGMQLVPVATLRSKRPQYKGPFTILTFSLKAI